MKILVVEDEIELLKLNEVIEILFDDSGAFISQQIEQEEDDDEYDDNDNY